MATVSMGLNYMAYFKKYANKNNAGGDRTARS